MGLDLIVFGFLFLFVSITLEESETQFAIIVSGDDGGSHGSVEVLREDGSHLCILPDLPNYRTKHTQSGLITCGGTYPTSTRKSCVTFSSGVWTQTHSLIESRYQHSSWLSPLGLVLMGGDSSSLTTELLTEEGTSMEFFDLFYDIVNACSIEFEDTVILTGGAYTMTKASVYSIDGYLEDLPDLKEGKRGHGCGHYVNEDNELVYLVTGGYTGKHEFTVSTEILVSGSSSWTQVGDLPTVPIVGLRGASINNKIIMTGGYDNSNKSHDYVLMYNPSDGSWSQVGSLKMTRSYHGVSIVPMDQISEFC